VDVFSAPESGSPLTLDVGMAIGPSTPGLTLEEWKRSTAEALTEEPCSAVEHERALTIDQQAGVLRTFHCSHFLEHDIFGMEAVSVHGSRGVFVVWTNVTGHEKADLAAFRLFLSSVRFSG
jgi:hypothetical protein